MLITGVISCSISLSLASASSYEFINSDIAPITGYGSRKVNIKPGKNYIEIRYVENDEEKDLTIVVNKVRSHHRADYDAEKTSEMFVKMLGQLKLTPAEARAKAQEMKKIAVLLVLSLIILSAANAVYADDDREYYVSDALIDLTVHENGLLHVKESYTYSFDGKFNGVYRDIPIKEGEDIKNKSIKIYNVQKKNRTRNKNLTR